MEIVQFASIIPYLGVMKRIDYVAGVDTFDLPLMAKLVTIVEVTVGGRHRLLGALGANLKTEFRNTKSFSVEQLKHFAIKGCVDLRVLAFPFLVQ